MYLFCLVISFCKCRQKNSLENIRHGHGSMVALIIQDNIYIVQDRLIPLHIQILYAVFHIIASSLSLSLIDR